MIRRRLLLGALASGVGTHFSKRFSNCHTVSGGYSVGATPVPIPNTAVKPHCVDGTARAAAWESRSPPDLSHKGPWTLIGSGAFFIAECGMRNVPSAECGMSRGLGYLAWSPGGDRGPFLLSSLSLTFFFKRLRLVLCEGPGLYFRNLIFGGEGREFESLESARGKERVYSD